VTVPFDRPAPPDQRDQAAGPDWPDQPLTPERRDRRDQAARPGWPDQAARPDQVGQSNQPAWPDRPIPPDHAAPPDRPDRPDQPDAADWPGRTNRPGRLDRAARSAAPAPTPAAVLLRLLPRIVLNAIVPLALYLLLSPSLGDVAALAIGAAVPGVATAVELLVRRRLDPVGAIALLAFVVVLVVFALTGGDPLVVKLHDAVLTGPVGLVLLASAAVRRPLLVVAGRLLRRPVPRRVLAAATVLAGVVMTVHAALILALALTLPTAVFLAVARPIGWAVIVVGVLVGWVLRRRQRA